MADTLQPLIFPLAHYVGTRYDSDTKTSTFQLRGGWKVANLTVSERNLWALAHGVPSELEKGTRWTKDHMLEIACPQMADAETVIASLLERDVLMEVTPGTKGAVEFAKEVRLIPLRLGLGNSPEDPSMWRIGASVEAFVAVNDTVFSTWQWSHLYKNLWESCKSIAKMRGEDHDLPTSREDRDPEAILSEVLKTTHILLASSCAYLDVPFEWGMA